jgi:hypothetical protein
MSLSCLHCWRRYETGVVSTARTGSPAPDAAPTAAVTQIAARGGEAAYRAAAHEDDPGAQEPHARHDLGGDPRGVQDHQAGFQDVGEPVFADQHEQRGADPGKRGAELLFQVLTDREEKESVAIASSESFGGWTKTFTGPRLCAAIVDRLTFGSSILELVPAPAAWRRPGHSRPPHPANRPPYALPRSRNPQ